MTAAIAAEELDGEFPGPEDRPSGFLVAVVEGEVFAVGVARAAQERSPEGVARVRGSVRPDASRAGLAGAEVGLIDAAAGLAAVEVELVG